MNINERVSDVLKKLKKEYSANKTALYFNSPFELLIATILSAQTTDIHVNKVTETLFKKYKTIEDYAKAPHETFQKDINSINFYKTKAGNIQTCARLILEKFNGMVPDTMSELITLPGVARKTANIVLSTVYGINEGIAVDTHVKRLAYRLGLTTNTDPVKIEKDLMAVTPQKEWHNISNLLISHGRKICSAKSPRHKECVLYDICPSKDI